MIEYLPDFAARFLPHPRTLGVWLPPGYSRASRRRYPVLYLHDGQNLFDARTAFGGVPWGADEAAEREILAGRVQPLILVGIANSPERLNEYGPRRESFGREHDPSRDYGRFLVEEVKPVIDATYRTRIEPEQTGVGGASMGALISLHLCQWYPGVFGKCAALSPSLWWDRENFLRTLKSAAGWLERCRVWLDVGEFENGTLAASAATIRRVRRLAALFMKLGLREGEHFHFEEVAGGTHNEACWGRRFDRVLRFLYGAESAARKW